MGKLLTNRQREIMYTKRGTPILSLEFDVFETVTGSPVSMWAHTRHDVPFTEMLAAFEAVAEHLKSFISDKDMCPFNPTFVQEVGEE